MIFGGSLQTFTVGTAYFQAGEKEKLRGKRGSSNPFYIHTLLDRTLGDTHTDDPAYYISLLAMQSDMITHVQFIFHQFKRKILMKIFAIKYQTNDRTT